MPPNELFKTMLDARSELAALHAAAAATADRACAACCCVAVRGVSHLVLSKAAFARHKWGQNRPVKTSATDC